MADIPDSPAQSSGVQVAEPRSEQTIRKVIKKKNQVERVQVCTNVSDRVGVTRAGTARGVAVRALDAGRGRGGAERDDERRGQKSLIEHLGL